MTTTTTSTEKKPASPRILVVDAVRGAAVLCMIQWHCADAWIGGAIRNGEAFAVTRVVGGFAAPLFLLLAGVSAALVFKPERTGAGVRRGIGIVAGGYAFKLWAWTVDYGAIVEARNWAAIACDAALLYAVWRACADGIAPKLRASLAALAFVLWLAVWFALNGTTRTPSVLWRLDVLQGIGAALVIVNLVLLAVHRLRAAPIVLLVLAVLVALATPSFIGADLSFLPERIADYVARTTHDASSGARFALFPWLGYTLLGAAIGRGVRATPPRDAWDVPFVRSGAYALALAVLVGLCAFEPMPVAQWLLARTEQVRNVVRLAWNASVATGFAGLGSLVLPRVAPLERAMLSLGRHSLIVYVVHLEIAFGLPCSPIRETLGFAGWALGASALTLSMVALSFWLDVREARASKAARAAL